jgi:hypothetical protein
MKSFKEIYAEIKYSLNPVQLTPLGHVIIFQTLRDGCNAKINTCRLLTYFPKNEITDYLFIDTNFIDLYKYYNYKKYSDFKKEVIKFLNHNNLDLANDDLTQALNYYNKTEKNKERVLKCLKSVWDKYIANK